MHDVDTSKVAADFGVTRRCAQKWAKEGHSVSDYVQLSREIMSMRRPAAKALAKAQLILSGLDKGAQPEPKASKNDASKDTPPDLIVPAVRMGDIEGGEDVEDQRMPAYCFKMMEAAANANTVNLQLVSYWQDRYHKAKREVRDAEWHAKRMGLEEGSIINRDTFERLVYALAFWMVRGVDLDLKQLAPKCVNLSFVEEAHGVLDRYFIRKRFLAPFAKAVSAESGVSLPKWAVDELKRAVDVFFEVDRDDADDVEAYEAFLKALGAIEGDRDVA